MLERARVAYAFCRVAGLLLVCASSMAAGPEAASSAADPVGPSYLDRLASFNTHLVRRGPSPQPFKVVTPPAGVQEVTYPSGPLMLKAWVAYPPGASAASQVPGVVFFHGGFGFGPLDLADARPFLEAGFAVMLPMLRGENGNPGDFEMALGEIVDAQAAVTWLAAQPPVDRGRLYTFGFSAGGIVSAMLSLRDSPIRHGGSSGGIPGPRLFDIDWLISTVPFDRSDPNERNMRVLVGNVSFMQHRHFAYIGANDEDQDLQDIRHEMQPGALLTVTTLPGDHFTSLAPAVHDYIERIRADP